MQVAALRAEVARMATERAKERRAFVREVAALHAAREEAAVLKKQACPESVAGLQMIH